MLIREQSHSCGVVVLKVMKPGIDLAHSLGICTVKLQPDPQPRPTCLAFAGYYSVFDDIAGSFCGI